MPDIAAPKKVGIAIIANDRVIDWLLPFLESYVATNSKIPLYLIPYDDNLTRTRHAAEVFGIEIADVDSAELDALARRLYPLNPGHRRRLRKFLALALPLDEVIYMDVDTIMLRDFSDVLGHVGNGKTEFLVACYCADYIYNSKHRKYDFLRDAFSFNDGFFVASRHILSLQDFYEVIAKDERIFHEVRQRGGLFAQPLTNFVVHRRGLKVACLPDCIPGASGESFYKTKKATFTPDGPLDSEGRRIYFCHWPGIIGLPRRRIFDGIWHEYARLAAERMRAQVPA
ncbi:MAG TPA: hypothetical protein VKV77_13065 [Methylovirgula sp.]|nr:hypothetical protein [Methylovirgula sp.]